ncbi:MULTISPECIES: hypothetical protein [Clostridium]|uniref:hypothetical protein n=1 Tax=Clostridium TaxID=1485 RepID=UPI0013E9499E|nr:MULTISPECIES: hypothetical protein [Clostridium]MBW9157467.1 hypothetical protein [Clostridium tagluense]MBZ9625726.1 hypothetical protein [Clostridium sp. FP2]MBZ9637139.1 hypothetical protein [Clostridium sp. FP1]WLC65479.1 hypothetical protein KTC93_22145 [Clostridium tagluense]
MGSIILHRKRKNDIIDTRLIEQAYGSDSTYKATIHTLEINTYADSSIISKSMVPSVDLEYQLRTNNNENLSK